MKENMPMFAVIFRAQVNELDEQYSTFALQMRTLAKEQYHCREFTSTTEGDQEIAISYWDSLEDINNWKNDPAHLAVQDRGRVYYYKNYRVQVVEVIREYTNQGL